MMATAMSQRKVTAWEDTWENGQMQCTGRRNLDIGKFRGCCDWFSESTLQTARAMVHVHACSGGRWKPCLLVWVDLVSVTPSMPLSEYEHCPKAGWQSIDHA